VDGALPVRKAMNYSALQWRAKTVCMVVCSDIARYATYHALSATMGSRHNKKLSYPVMLVLGLKDKICGLGLVIVWPWPWP